MTKEKEKELNPSLRNQIKIQEKDKTELEVAEKNLKELTKEKFFWQRRSLKMEKKRNELLLVSSLIVLGLVIVILILLV